MATSDNSPDTSLNPLTSSAEVTHASHSHKPESAAEPKTPGIFGQSSREYFAFLDPDGSCWKTSQATLALGSDLFWETWPDSGTMRNGRVYALRTSARVTSGKGCSSSRTWNTPALESQANLWQTPATDSFRSRGGDRKDEPGLDQQARMFPTPAARDYRTPNLNPDQHTDQLQNFVEHQTWPTPTESTATLEDMEQSRYAGNGGKRPAYSRCSPPDPPTPAGQESSETAPTSRRRLNPRFVEWLMGFIPGWTEL